MTDKQIARKAESLHKKAQTAYNTYSRARGRRRDKGVRIESRTETAARYRATLADSDYRTFCLDNGIKSESINY
jgi:hypothetical protein